MARKIGQSPEKSAITPQLIGISDLAKILGCSVMTCRRMEASGRIPRSIRTDSLHHRRWAIADINAHIEAASVAVRSVK